MMAHLVLLLVKDIFVCQNIIYLYKYKNMYSINQTRVGTFPGTNVKGFKQFL